MKVSAIVVSHGHAAEVERLVPILRPQVDDLVLIENVQGSVHGEPEGTRVLRNVRPLTFAANVNRGVAETGGELVLVANPDALRRTLKARPNRSIVALRSPPSRCWLSGSQGWDAK